MAGFLPGYSASITSEASKRRYNDKLKLLQGIDPYEVDKTDWEDDLDLWPAITHVHACMYLILTPSPYTANDIFNYKSLDLYQNFVKGWVRRVLMKPVVTKEL
uniref:Uncharacterized protein n=1 Tax=Amphimedon queenslandica TaxID=400682 RepID=A0A1X7VAN3_AMPQE